jgi:hypothetical protein
LINMTRQCILHNPISTFFSNSHIIFRVVSHMGHLLT